MKRSLAACAAAIAVLLGCGHSSAQQVPIISMAVPPPLPTSAMTILQTFNYDVPDPSVMLGNISWVWGAVDPATGNPAPVPNIPSFVYWPATRNGSNINNLQCVGCVTGGTNPYWDWFLAHHPDWIEYTYDEVTPSWVFSTFNAVPLNVQDPNVFNFVTTGAGSGGATTNLLGELTNAFPGGNFAGVSFDNVSYENPFGDFGHYAGAKPGPGCTETAPQCGGTFVQDFPYPPVIVDPVYQSVIKTWTQKIHTWVNAQGKLMICNTQGPSLPSNAVPEIQTALACNDIVGSEDFFMDSTSRGGCPDGITPFHAFGDGWITLFSYINTINKSKGMAFFDQLCPGITPATAQQTDVSWGTANFLLARTGNSYYSAVYSLYSGYPSYWFPPCGTAAWTQAPLQQEYLNSGGSHERILTVGPGDAPGSKLCYVEVNPNGQPPNGTGVGGPSTTYVLPAGTWEDQFGNSLAVGVNTLPASQGVVAIQISP